jgi:hypothetical protein
MAGILDKKSRILDYVITENGRSQLSDNDIRYKYASLSDRSILYTKDHDLTSTNKSDVSNAELNYIPLEVLTKNNSTINPEFDLRKYFDNTSININIPNIIQNGDTSDVHVDTYLTQFSLASYLQSLKLLKTKNMLNSDKLFTFFNDGDLYKDLDFKNSVLKYSTIRDIDFKKENASVIALDKRFTHKLNFQFLPPINSSGENLYSTESFSNLEELSESNNIGYMFPTYNSNLNTIKSDSRTEQILNIVRNLEKNKAIHKKKYILENTTESDSLIFELHEVQETINAAGNITKVELEKIHFVKLGDFYDKNLGTTKKIYLIGKFFNTRENTKDLDILFNFNDGNISLDSDKSFALSAFFSFVCLFTLIIE